MKRILFLLVTICFITLTIFKVDANNLTFPLIGKTIVIDPGHGGLDQGASYQDIFEAELNLEISIKIKDELEKQGGIVIMTREGNYDLSRPNAIYRKKSDFDNRIKLINNADADLYLSIHLNKYPNASYYGPQIFYVDNYKENKNIAEILQRELNDNLNTKRQIKRIGNAYYMYEKLNVKGVLIECGFLSNTKERTSLLKGEYQKELARIISKGIIKYYS